ncbi:MAG: efflux RND transporter periplasmic adaptor subunit [Hydrogenophaga sp.]|uniref:efflux RND transporter periplasmic adaptor subunit n=1 Tax=Hydrogenophaga sp. TaxID=1904254 RepID=UPI003D9AC9C3
MWSLKSPVNGRVLKLHKDNAEPVQAGAPLLEIGDTGAMEAVIDVLSGDAPRIATGAAVQLSTGRNEPPLAGTVALKAPPEELQKLGDGFRVDARITVSAQDGALLVPSAALVRQGEGWQVFVVEAGKARARAVSFSDRNADSAWVKDGLKAGESVVLYPGSGMRDGLPVKNRESGS